MRTLIVSDLHSNLSALSAVFKKVRRKRIDRIICLGDFVGYGAEPNQVLDIMRTYPAERFFIRGNHDRVASGLDSGEGFNHAALSAALWTREKLSRVNRHFLRSLKIGPLVDASATMICHGSPFDEDQYLFGGYHAADVFEKTNAPLVLFGHTHLPAIFSFDDRTGELDGELVRNGGTFKLNPGKRYLVNPGSVGQPRDRNPLSAFAILDDVARTMTFLRVDYDIAATQRTIREAGLPYQLADRLRVGS